MKALQLALALTITVWFANGKSATLGRTDCDQAVEIVSNAGAPMVYISDIAKTPAGTRKTWLATFNLAQVVGWQDDAAR